MFLFHIIKSKKSQFVSTNLDGLVVSKVCLSESSLPLLVLECAVHHYLSTSLWTEMISALLLLYCVSFGSLATESLLWCWTWGLAITGLWLFVGGRWFLGLGGSPCGDCSPWFRGGIGSFVKRNGWAGDAISLLRSECSVWRPVYWDQGRKVSPRKSMVQSASQ